MAWMSFATQGLAEDWHESDEFNQAFQRFHATYALEPRESLSKAMATHRQFTMQLESHLKNRGISSHVEYIGSLCEGIEIPRSAEDDPLEFEIMVVIDNYESLLEVIDYENKPGYARLKLHQEPEPKQWLTKVLKASQLVEFSVHERYVDADKTAEVFYKELESCIAGSLQMKGRAQARREGSVVHMDVYPDSGTVLWGQRLFVVDILPAFRVGDGLYVSKPIKGEEMPDTVTWRRSFSVEEMKKLLGGSKTVLRILKALRNRESELAALNSYQLKTAVLYELDAEPDWSEQKLALRFFGVIYQLEKFLSQGNLPNYFIPPINLLSSLSPETVSSLRDRIKLIRTNKVEMMKSFNS